MLVDLLTQFVAAAADALVGQVDAAVKSQEDMRTRHNGYRKDLAAAQNVADKSAAAITSECSARYQSWLDHPSFGHSALVQAGRLAHNNLVALVAAHQKSPLPVLFVNLTLATIRLAAITPAVGEECIFPPPVPGPPRAGAGKKVNKRKSRQRMTVDNIGSDLLSPVARLAGDSKVRAQAVAELKSAILNDKTGIAAKLHVLATTPAHRPEIDALAHAAADKLATAAQPDIPAQPEKPTGTTPITPPAASPACSAGEDEEMAEAARC